jgi:hypothetical protein
MFGETPGAGALAAVLTAEALARPTVGSGSVGMAGISDNGADDHDLCRCRNS